MNPMPDNWIYVLAAYGIAAVAVVGYWRYLLARGRTLHDGRRRSIQPGLTSPTVGSEGEPSGGRGPGTARREALDNGARTANTNERRS